MKLLCMIAVFCASLGSSDAQKQDWGNLKRYAEANKELVRKGKQKDRVVLWATPSRKDGWQTMPLSLKTTVMWPWYRRADSSIPAPFREDVIKLAPALVVINAGTNDIAEMQALIMKNTLLEI